MTEAEFEGIDVSFVRGDSGLYPIARTVLDSGSRDVELLPSDRIGSTTGRR
jgi:hypothetical protein